MKNLIGIILISVLTGCAAQLSPLAPEWKATIKVVDETAQPLSGATVTIGYYVPPPAGESIAVARKTGQTDTEGVFSASERSRSYDLTFKAQKEGYYPSSQIYELGHPSQYNASRWSPKLTLTLKKIGQPIPMYAKRVNTHVPVMNKPLGFDLMAGDWVAPNGRGKDTDILFTASMNERAKDDFDYKLVVSFPNPGDGIQPFLVSEVEKASALRSPQIAAEEGYKNEWIKTQSHRPGQPSTLPLDEKLNFFFRVRTLLDEKGNVKRTQYGKIYGDFMNFRYYLNPNQNSRNIEFDPKQNLLKGSRGSQIVEAP